MPDTDPRESAPSPIPTGLLGRCPRCGKGSLFSGFLTLTPRCETCGLDTRFADTGDGPSFFASFLGGFLTLLVGVYAQIVYSPAWWVYALLLTLGVATTILMIRPMKGVLVALQYANKAEQGRFEPTRPGAVSSQLSKANSRALIAPALATLVAFLLLVGLGVWQLHRLAWKNELIAEIDARAHAAPASPPPAADWAALRPGDYEYRHVALDGTFDNAKETLVFRPSEDGPGYLVMTPLALASGGTVIVSRGWVPDRLKDHASRTAGDLGGPVKVTGLMRAPETRNLFTPADDLATGQFFTKDPTTIAARDGVTAAPFVVDADAAPANPGGWPRGGATVIDIPNNHFSYAMTWFGLALTLLGVFGSYARKRLKGDAELSVPPDPASAGAG